MKKAKKTPNRLHRFTITPRSFGAFLALVLVVSVIAGLGTYKEDSSSAARDPWVRPYSAKSIWNTPIGSNARYVDAGYPVLARNSDDLAYFLKLKSSDPLVDHVLNGGWQERCSGTQKTGTKLNLPVGFRIPPPRQNADGSWSTPNNGWEFLLPDGKTIYNSGAGARCSDTGPIFGHPATDATRRTDIYGDGLLGGHGASRLPRLGGALRPNELNPSTGPIRHVLDLVLYTKYAYSDNKQTKESTYRWPATSSDSYALDRDDDKQRYMGRNPALRMGSLLALRPTLKPSDLNITSPEGIKFFKALQDWGGYWTDDSAWDANYITVDAAATYEKQWIGTTQAKAELGRMIGALAVVDNNGPNSIGGGGTPRAPLHECLSTEPNCHGPGGTPTPSISVTPTPTTTPTPTGSVSPTPTPTQTSGADLVVTDITWSPATPQVGQGLTFSATIRNQGSVASSSVYHAVNFLVNGQRVSFGGESTPLAAGASRTVTATNGPNGVATWTPTDNGTYTLTAIVDDANNITESNESNNTFAKSIVLGAVTKPGDANGDSAINIFDLNLVLSHWGRTDRPQGDINADGKVDIQDFNQILSNWGK